MILPLWRRQPSEHFVDFRSQEKRLAVLEANQRRVHEAILAYVEADIASTWMSTAKELAEALREAIKE